MAVSDTEVPPIVVGVDGSDSCAVLDWAAEEAAVRGCVLEAVTVAGPRDRGTETAAGQVRSAAERYPTVHMRHRLLAGAAGPALVRAARGAAMLVVGNRAAGRLARVLVGSVASYCVAHAECPVVIDAGWHGAATRARRPVVVGVDGSFAAQQALRWAMAEAEMRGCPVRVVHAWSPGGIRDFMWTSHRTLRADSQSLLRAAVAAARRQTDTRVEVTCDSLQGPAAAALVATAADASLLVLGVHTGRRRPGSLGAIGTYCAGHTAVPLVIIPAATLPNQAGSAAHAGSSN